LYSGCWYNGKRVWEGRRLWDGRAGGKRGDRKLTKEYHRDRQTDRMKGIEKGSWQTVVEQCLGRDITRKKREERENHQIR
jgi:hypothetical protein